MSAKAEELRQLRFLKEKYLHDYIVAYNGIVDTGIAIDKLKQSVCEPVPKPELTEPLPE
jgi:hypothetical protein